MNTAVQNTEGTVTHSARQLLDLAREWIKQGNTSVAGQLLGDALKKCIPEENRSLKGEIVKDLGRVHLQNGDWDRAEDAFRQAEAIFLELGLYSGAAQSIRNLANLKFQLGRFEESDTLCEKAVDWATQAGDFQLRATILNTQGAIKSIEGKQKDSLKIFKLCLSDFRKAGNKLRQAYVLHNIGLAYYELGEYEKSKASFEEALMLAMEARDTSLVEICYQNFAKLYLKLGDIVAARSLIVLAQELLGTLKSPALATDLAIIEASSYRLSGDPGRAGDILDQALEKARTNNLLQHEAEILYESGQVAADSGRPEIARSRLEAAIKLFQQTGGSRLKDAVEKLKNLQAATTKGEAA
jgi:tetratricopeptide (TPR) repeat protein